MKRPNLLAIAAIIVILGVLLGAAALRQNEKFAFKLSAQEMHAKVVSESHRISAEEIKTAIEKGGLVVVDIRTPKEYINNHIPEAINIPYERILDDELEDFFKDGKSKILYCNKDEQSNAAWMILTQYGYENMTVLNGGMEAWKATVENKDVFKGKYPSDEVAKFDYAKKVKGEGEE